LYKTQKKIVTTCNICYKGFTSGCCIVTNVLGKHKTLGLIELAIDTMEMA